jgi:hypothetical protein
MIAGHFSMDFKKLPSTTPPLWPQNTQIHFTTQKKDGKEKRSGEKKRLGRTRKLENSLEALATLAGGASATHFAGRKEEELLRVAQEDQHEREKEREREREREGVGRETKTTGNGRL